MKTYVVYVEIHYDTADDDHRNKHEIMQAVKARIDDDLVLSSTPGTGIYSFAITNITRRY